MKSTASEPGLNVFSAKVLLQDSGCLAFTYWANRSRFGQMVSKIQERWISSRTRVYHLYKSVSFTEKRLRRRETGIKDGFEVNGTRISVWNILSWKTGLPFQKFRCSRKISTGTTQTVLFPLFCNRIFRKFFVNGKQPFLISFGDEILHGHPSRAKV